MEVKCKVCGTINNSDNPFCKGCFLPLHKTMQEWTRDIENKINSKLTEETVDKTTVLHGDVIPTGKIIEEGKTIIMPEVDEKTIYKMEKVIEPKEVDNIKEDLKSLSIINHEEKFDKNEKSPFSLAFKFNFILIFLTGIFTYFYGLKIDTNQDILYGALATMLISSIAIVLTFYKNYPSKDNISQTLSIIFVTVILIEMAFRSILLYNAGINYLYYYLFVYVVYILITIMIINAINKFIRRNIDCTSNFISKLNVFTIIFIIIILLVAAWAKNTNYQVIKKDLVDDETTVEYNLPEELKVYISSINNKIYDSINSDPNYKIPVLIDDVNFVDNSIGVEKISLSVDEYGTVSSGDLKYNGIVYKYKY